MIFEKKKILVWSDDPLEDRVISIFAGCLTNHDRAHTLSTNFISSTHEVMTTLENKY